MRAVPLLLLMACTAATSPDGPRSPLDSAGTSPASPVTVTVVVDETVEPAIEQIDGWVRGTRRHVDGLSVDDGPVASFVRGEVLLYAKDAHTIAGFVARRGGEVVATAGSRLHVVRVDLDTVDPEVFAKDVVPLAQDDFSHVAVGSAEGLALLAIVAEEARAGLVVGPNWVGEPSSLLDGTTAEAPDLDVTASAWNVDYTPDAYTWPHLADVVDVWTMLEVRGAVGSTVGVAVLDRGFSSSGDLAGVEVGSGFSWPAKDGDSIEVWHAHSVGSALLAPVDDGAGGAGVAGPVADGHLVYAGPDLGSLTRGLLVAEARGDRVALVPFAALIPPGLGWASRPAALAWQELAKATVIVAPSGNVPSQGVMPDRVTTVPCAFPDVVCAAALDVDGQLASWTVEPKDAESYSVAPGVHWIGPPPDAVSDAAREVAGTSYAAAYVAGTAALMLAADPEQTAAGVRAGLSGTPVEVFDRRFRWRTFSGAVAGGAVTPALPLQLGPADVADIDVVTTSDARTGSALILRVKNPTGENVYADNWLSPRGERVVHRFTELATLDEAWRPTTLELKSQVGRFDYVVLAAVRERAGYNRAGTDLVSARELSDGETVYGNLRGEEYGHTYAFWLDPGQAVSISGTFTGPESTGTNARVDVYDDAETLVTQRLFQGAAYGTVEVGGTFTHEGAARSRFVFRVVNGLAGQTWELLD